MEKLRKHSEDNFKEELEELVKQETNKTPTNWKMSPKSVLTYLLGGKLKTGLKFPQSTLGIKG